MGWLIWKRLNSQVQLCQTGQRTNKSKSNVCSKDFSPYISGFKRCDSEKPGFWPNLRAQTQYLEKPGFWPPFDSEKPGFWPNLRAQTKYLEKTRFLAPVRLRNRVFCRICGPKRNIVAKNPVSGPLYWI